MFKDTPKMLIQHHHVLHICVHIGTPVGQMVLSQCTCLPYRCEGLLELCPHPYNCWLLLAMLWSPKDKQLLNNSFYTQFSWPWPAHPLGTSPNSDANHLFLVGKSAESMGRGHGGPWGPKRTSTSSLRSPCSNTTSFTSQHGTVHIGCWVVVVSGVILCAFK